MLFRFLKAKSGATAIEYALVAGLIGLAIVSGAGAMGNQLFDLWTGNSNAVQQVFGEAPG